jgi:hypothetical protein
VLPFFFPSLTRGLSRRSYLIEILSAGNSRHPRAAVEGLLGRPLVATELAAALAEDTAANVFMPVEQV